MVNILMLHLNLTHINAECRTHINDEHIDTAECMDIPMPL